MKRDSALPPGRLAAAGGSAAAGLICCRRAGLPQCTAHGLRKALTRRGAEADVTQQGLKALGQWSNDREVATYVAGVNQTRLRESAIDAIWRWERDANL